MHIHITGINGLLGQNIVNEFAPDHTITGVDIGPSIFHDIDVAQLDLTNTTDLKKHIHKYSPDVVVHTAAYTNVDKAEDEEDLAYRLNAMVPEELARLCCGQDIPLIHISTDYVFDGENGPYRESDPCNPKGVYAESKYAGERAVMVECNKVAVIRPNVMYGHGYDLKSSFVDWLILELSEGRPVNIVDDQFNNPSNARRLAAAIRTIIDNNGWDIWHFGSKEVVSRYTFALQIADVFGLPTELINAISTGALNQAAPRPMRSGLICEKIEQELGVNILSINDELRLLKEEMNVA